MIEPRGSIKIIGGGKTNYQKKNLCSYRQINSAKPSINIDYFFTYIKYYLI